jgi:omega-6 fatty acid desaturase (delta-12 desaturase)
LKPKQEGTVRPKSTKPDWLKDVAKYGKADRRRALWQIANTFVPYMLLWVLMVGTVQLGYSYWLTLALAVVASGFMVRIFILFHDCTHGSFFASQRANTVLGYITGIITFTPFDEWRYSHAVHHGTAGDLDRRGVGDIWTMTVSEYQAAGKGQRLLYRLFRNPFFLFGLGPSLKFLIVQRFPKPGGKRRHRMSVYITDLAILAIILVAALTIGLKTYLLVQLPIMVIGGAAGVWLFYVQHQYEGVYWARHEEWDPFRAALDGSSYYKLPKVLQWFTGNIGFHHIHHLRARIPNYRLQKCYEMVPAMQAIKPLSLMSSVKCLWLNLWDEERQRLVSFREARLLSQQGVA